MTNNQQQGGQQVIEIWEPVDKEAWAEMHRKKSKKELREKAVQEALAKLDEILAKPEIRKVLEQ